MDNHGPVIKLRVLAEDELNRIRSKAGIRKRPYQRRPVVHDIDRLWSLIEGLISRIQILEEKCGYARPHVREFPGVEENSVFPAKAAKTADILKGRITQLELILDAPTCFSKQKLLKGHCPVTSCRCRRTRFDSLRKHINETAGDDHELLRRVINECKCIKCDRNFERPEDLARHDRLTHASSLSRVDVIETICENSSDKQDVLDQYEDLLTCTNGVTPGSSVFNNRPDLISQTDLNNSADNRHGESDFTLQVSHNIGPDRVKEVARDSSNMDSITPTEMPRILNATVQTDQSFMSYTPPALPPYIFSAHPSTTVSSSQHFSSEISEWNLTANHVLFNPHEQILSAAASSNIDPSISGQPQETPSYLNMPLDYANIFPPISGRPQETSSYLSTPLDYPGAHPAVFPEPENFGSGFVYNNGDDRRVIM